MKNNKIILDIHFINLRQLIKLRDCLDSYKKNDKIEKTKVTSNNKNA